VATKMEKRGSQRTGERRTVSLLFRLNDVVYACALSPPGSLPNKSVYEKK